MRERLAQLAAAFRRRFNPRLHPLAAVGIGLGISALLLPDPAADPEIHSEAEILERLAAPGLDLQHGPGFWLEEKSRETALYGQALELCRRPEHALRPNCRLLTTLDRAGRGWPEDGAAPTPQPPAPDLPTAEGGR